MPPRAYFHERALCVYDILTKSVSEAGQSLDAIRCTRIFTPDFFLPSRHTNFDLIFLRRPVPHPHPHFALEVFPFLVFIVRTRSLYNTTKFLLLIFLKFRCNSLLRYQSTPEETG